MSRSRDSLIIFSSPSAAPSSQEVRRGLGDALRPAWAKASEVAVETLQKNMQTFLLQVDTILREAPHCIGGLAVDEVEIYAQIDSEGNIGIASVAGAQLGMQGGLRFVLRKQSSKDDPDA